MVGLNPELQVNWTDNEFSVAKMVLALDIFVLSTGMKILAANRQPKVDEGAELVKRGS